MGGVREHGDGVQDRGCDRRVEKSRADGEGLCKVGQSRLREERGTIPPAYSCHQEESLLQVVLGQEQTREALPGNILKEESEDSKALCSAWSVEGETTHPPNTSAPLKELKHPGKHPWFKSTPQPLP